MKDKTGLVLNFTYPTFERYVRPDGFLCNATRHRDCHALFYYYLTSRLNYEQIVLNRIIEYEGSPSAETHFRKCLETIANIYGVKPNDMTKHWGCVDMQCLAEDLPKLPDEERYRFNKTGSVVTIR